MDSEFITSALGGGVWAPTFFDDAKFQMLKIFSEFFYLQSALDSEFLRGGV